MKNFFLLIFTLTLASCTTTKYVYNVNDDLYYSTPIENNTLLDNNEIRYSDNFDEYCYTQSLRRFYQPYFGLSYFNDYYRYRGLFWPNDYYVNFFYRYDRGWNYIYNPYWGWNNWCYTGWNNNWGWNTPDNLSNSNTYYGHRGNNSPINTNTSKFNYSNINERFGLKTIPKAQNSYFKQKNYESNFNSRPNIQNRVIQKPNQTLSKPNSSQRITPKLR